MTISIESSGSMIGLGIPLFFAFLFARLFKDDFGLNQDTLNVLGLVGGIGLISLIVGFYYLFKNIDWNNKEELQNKTIRDAKNKEQDDKVINKYNSMPDLSRQKNQEVMKD